MKTLVYELKAPCQLVINEQNLNDESLAKEEILAKTLYSAVSPGTEIAAWKGLPPLRPSTGYPRLIGYCNLAQVINIGEAITNVKVGDYILTHQSHRSAFICKPNDVLIRFEALEKEILKKITPAYLYHLGYSALIKGGYQPGLQVAIVGMGTLGILAAELVKLYGLEPIILTNQHNTELFASTYNFSKIFKKDPVVLNEIQKICLMDGVDIVINTSNKWEDHFLSMQIVRAGGEIICIGFPGRGESLPENNPLDSQYFYDKQLSIRHSGYVAMTDLNPMDSRFTLKKNMHYFASLILQNKLNPERILSIETNWDNLESVYKKLSMQKESMYSALLDWREICVQQ